jgi:hypothetical protein
MATIWEQRAAYYRAMVRATTLDAESSDAHADAAAADPHPPEAEKAESVATYRAHAASYRRTAAEYARMARECVEDARFPAEVVPEEKADEGREVAP